MIAQPLTHGWTLASVVNASNWSDRDFVPDHRTKLDSSEYIKFTRIMQDSNPAIGIQGVNVNYLNRQVNSQENYFAGKRSLEFSNIRVPIHATARGRVAHNDLVSSMERTRPTRKSVFLQTYVLRFRPGEAWL